MPLVPPRLEHHRLGQCHRAAVLEVVLEERELDLVSIPLRRRRVERDRSEPVAGRARPAAVEPRPHHEHVARHRRAQPLDRSVDVQRAVEVFGVEPSADGHHRRAHVAQTGRQASRLPELVVGAVTHQVVPEPDLALEVALVRVSERTEVEIELVGVRRPELEAGRKGRRRLRPLLAEDGVEAERVHQEEGAVVVEVVGAPEPFRDGRLRRDGLERRVRVDRPGRRVEPRIRDAPHPDATAIVRNGLHQEVDRVPRVGALVDPGRFRPAHVLGPDVDELALRHEPAADVLVREDVAAVLEPARRTERVLVLVGAVRPDAVGRAAEHDRVGLRRIFRAVDDRVEPHAVAHRDRVDRLCEARLWACRGLRRDGTGHDEPDHEDRPQPCYRSESSHRALSGESSRSVRRRRSISGSPSSSSRRVAP